MSIEENSFNAWDDLAPEELDRMRSLTLKDVAFTDQLILEACSSQWQKVAKIVAVTMGDFESKFPEVSLLFLSYRIQELSFLGNIEVAGDPFDMRHSEVRLGSHACST